MEPPDEWPGEIKESYDPIRILGKGGFASVVLASEKNAAATASSTSMNTTSIGSKKNKVAIKVVGGIHETGLNYTIAEIQEQRNTAVLYARREIEILNHVKHPNIIRLYNHWIAEDSEDVNMKNEECLTAAVLVLEYARGPTIESLLKHGGALSTTFGRVVIAQAMDAITYLHSHAVLHRDIKPDNILVTGAMSSDDSIWDNEEDADEVSLVPNQRPQPNWEALRSKYKVTLIDFGFARALTPNDVSTPSIKISLEDSQLASYHRIQTDDSYMDSIGGIGDDLGSSQRFTSNRSLRKRISEGVLDSSFHRLLSSSSGSDKRELNKSISHRMKRTMSALGNRNFAAPEIINQVRPRNKPNIGKPDQGSTTETISNYVADYGLLVDSYSMGHTIRYMMTGVQPGLSVEDAIKHQQRAGCIAYLFLPCFGGGNGNEKQKRSVRYRSMEELPGEVYRMIGALTQTSEKIRLSIRKARWGDPWIADVFGSQEPSQEVPLAQNGEEPSRGSFYSISYLPFADVKRESDHTTSTARASFVLEPTESSERNESALSF